MTNCLSVFDHFVGLALKGLHAQVKLKQIKVKYSTVRGCNDYFREKAIIVEITPSDIPEKGDWSLNMITSF